MGWPWPGLTPLPHLSLQITNYFFPAYRLNGQRTLTMRHLFTYPGPHKSCRSKDICKSAIKLYVQHSGHAHKQCIVVRLRQILLLYPVYPSAEGQVYITCYT